MKFTKDQLTFQKFFKNLEPEQRYSFAKYHIENAEEGFNIKVTVKECKGNSKFEDYDYKNKMFYYAKNYTDNNTALIRVTFK